MCVEYDLDYYRNFSLSRDIRGLQMIRDSRWFKISPEDAKKLELKEGESIVVESSSGKINGLVKVSESVPKGMIRANFLWSEEPDFSMADLVFPLSWKSLFLNLFPAKIKRGKR